MATAAVNESPHTCFRRLEFDPMEGVELDGTEGIDLALTECLALDSTTEEECEVVNAAVSKKLGTAIASGIDETS